MISTVLAEAHGVITEDRFQKMTNAQWYFQYKAIRKYREEQQKQKLQEKLLLQSMLTEEIDSLSMVINLKSSKEYLRMKNERRKKHRENVLAMTKPGSQKEPVKLKGSEINTVDVSDEKAVEEIMKRDYDTVPATIVIPMSVINQHKYIYPKFNRAELRKSGRRFIQMDSESEKKIEKEIPNTPEIKITLKEKRKSKDKITLAEEGEKDGNE